MPTGVQAILVQTGSIQQPLLVPQEVFWPWAKHSCVCFKQDKCWGHLLQQCWDPAADFYLLWECLLLQGADGQQVDAVEVDWFLHHKQYTADCSLSKHCNGSSHSVPGNLLGEKLRPKLYWYKNISHFSVQGIQLLSKSSKWKTAHQVLCVGQVTGSGSLWLRVGNYVSRVEPQWKTTRIRYHPSLETTHYA